MDEDKARSKVPHTADEGLWKDFLLTLKDPTKQNSSKNAGTKSKRPAEADTTIEPVVKKHKTIKTAKQKISNDTTKCQLLHAGHLPYKVVFETKPSIYGVYKIAYENEALYVGSQSSNVIKQLRRHFTKHGNSEVYNFMMTLSEDEKQKITVFWLDETVHDHKCGKTYLKCIETIQGSKPRFNTRKGTNETKDPISRDHDGTSCLPVESSMLFQNDDKNSNMMLDPFEAETPPTEQDINKESSESSEPVALPDHPYVRPTSTSNLTTSAHQRLSALSSLQRKPIQSTAASKVVLEEPSSNILHTGALFTRPEKFTATSSRAALATRPAARIAPTAKQGKVAPSRKKATSRKKKSGSSCNMWGGFKRSLGSIWSWMFGK